MSAHTTVLPRGTHTPRPRSVQPHAPGPDVSYDLADLHYYKASELYAALCGVACLMPRRNGDATEY